LFLVCIRIDGAMDSTTADSVLGLNSTTSEVQLLCPRETVSAACTLYSFVVGTVIIGLLAVLGSVGNVVSFVVFYRDKIKTSTTFLFQVVSLSDSCMGMGRVVKPQ